jgi:hypothetical protein
MRRITVGAYFSARDQVVLNNTYGPSTIAKGIGMIRNKEAMNPGRKEEADNGP